MLDLFKGTVTPKDWAAVGVMLSITLILVVVFYFFVYQKQAEAIVAVNAELKVVRENLAKARETEKNIEQLREEARKMDLLVNLFEQRLPERREIQRLIQSFESLGSQLGLRVQLEALPTILDQTKETIPYKITATGNFHQIVGFINLLEKDTRYLKISDLSIGEQSDGISTGTFTLSTFRFIQPTTTVAAGAQETNT